MIKLPQRETKNLLAIHGWSGVLLGLLLYAVIVTGVASVFEHEIGNWASPLAAPPQALYPDGLDAKIRELAAEVDPQFHEELAMFETAGGRLNLMFHKHETNPEGKPDERGVEFELDPTTLQVLDRREGWFEQIDDQRNAGALEDFLVHLHVRLYLPFPWGLLLTGVLGLVMMIAAVTGFVIHRHLIKEMFTLRRNRDKLLGMRDAHVIAGTWNLPFAFILAFTGSFFSFASALGIPAMALVVFGGDQEKMIEEVIGLPTPPDETPATPANFDRIMADARSRGYGEPGFVSLSHYGRADASVTLFVEPRPGELTATTFVYSGATGAFLREKPSLGLVPSFGGTLNALMAPLHFGNFAGVLSKAVWFALGFAGAYVTLTGMLLWTQRRAEQRAWRVMTRAIHWFGYGLPLALVGSAYGFYIARMLDLALKPAPGWAFVIAVGATLAATLALPAVESLRRLLLTATGIGMLLLPLLRLFSGGVGWPAAWHAGQDAVIAMDLALAIGGVACLLMLRRRAAARSPSAAAPASVASAV